MREKFGGIIIFVAKTKFSNMGSLFEFYFNTVPCLEHALFSNIYTSEVSSEKSFWARAYTYLYVDYMRTYQTFLQSFKSLTHRNFNHCALI